MAKKQIYVVYTGGTLGMQKTERGFRPVPNWFEQQLRSLPEFNSPEMPGFTLHEYSPLLDSSDIHPQHWQTIAQDIVDNYEYSMVLSCCMAPILWPTPLQVCTIC